MITSGLLCSRSKPTWEQGTRTSLIFCRSGKTKGNWEQWAANQRGTWMGRVGHQTWFLGWLCLHVHADTPPGSRSLSKALHRQSSRTTVTLLWQSHLLLYTTVSLRQRMPSRNTPQYHKREQDYRCCSSPEMISMSLWLDGILYP